MNKKLKWILISIGGVLALAIVLVSVFYLIMTSGSRELRRTVIEQELIPTGIEGTFAFVNVNIIPMDSQHVLEDQSVIIKDGHIAEIGHSSTIQAPAEALVVQGEGKFLLPGLSDMHIHLFGSENDLLLYLANGVTTIRDMGAGPITQLEWRDQINSGTRTGPNMLQWSPLADTMSTIVAIIDDLELPGGKVNVNDPEKMEGLVAKFASQGYDGIKSHEIWSVDIVQAILDSAKKHRLPSDAHIPVDLYWREDKEASWDTFRKMEFEAVSHIEELIKVVDWSDVSIRNAAQDVADDGIWVSTTIALMRSIEEQISDLEAELAKIPEKKYVNPGPLKRWFPPENFYPTIDRDWSPYLTANEKMLIALNEAGALLLSGTDSPLPLLVPGFSIHEELEVMVDVGLSPYDVLKTSTYNPALYLGELDEFGTIEVGKRADLVLLRANPLEDITNTQLIDGVMVRGRWYPRTDLNIMLELVAKANHE